MQNDFLDFSKYNTEKYKVESFFFAICWRSQAAHRVLTSISQEYVESVRKLDYGFYTPSFFFLFPPSLLSIYFISIAASSVHCSYTLKKLFSSGHFFEIVLPTTD